MENFDKAVTNVMKVLIHIILILLLANMVLKSDMFYGLRTNDLIVICTVLIVYSRKEH